MSANRSRRRLEEAFTDIVEGKNVKRSKHDLTWESHPFVSEFVKALQRSGFRRTTVREVPVTAGQRAPAFVIVGTVAYFGWVFWEKFTDRAMRKLFGSVVRNGKGDWAVQIPSGNNTHLYVNEKRLTNMDIDAPSPL